MYRRKPGGKRRMLPLLLAIALSAPWPAAAAVPGWAYNGFASFPAAFFGANMTGPPNTTRTVRWMVLSL